MIAGGEITAWHQVGAFIALVVAGWWVGAYPHDDGFDYPLQRFAERQATAARIDPGVALAHRQQEGT